MRISRLLALVAVLAVALLAVSCTSPHPNLTTARNDCAAVGRLSGASPGDRTAWIKQIVTARRSGVSLLDQAMRDLALALQGTPSTSAGNRAFTEVTTACARVKLWRVYHG